MGTFDPNVFLDATFTDANSTVSVPCPPGEYLAVVADEPKMRQAQGQKDASKTYLMLDLLWTIEDPAVTEVTSRKPTKVRQSIMLDLTETGALDMSKGHNVQLGRLREAVGLNSPGQAFSFRQLQGQQAKIQVVNRPDPQDPERIYDDVKAVVRAA